MISQLVNRGAVTALRKATAGILAFPRYFWGLMVLFWNFSQKFLNSSLNLQEFWIFYFSSAESFPSPSYLLLFLVCLPIYSNRLFDVFWNILNIFQNILFSPSRKSTPTFFPWVFYFRYIFLSIPLDSRYFWNISVFLRNGCKLASLAKDLTPNSFLLANHH